MQANSNQHDLAWGRRLYDIREYKNPDLGIFPVANVPLEVSWDSLANKPEHLVIPGTMTAPSRPLTVWILGGIIDATFATPKNNHTDSVHISVQPLMTQDTEEAYALIRRVSPGPVSTGPSPPAASRSQGFHVPGSRMKVFHPFDSAWDGRTALTAKDKMNHIDARSLKTDDIVLLEIEVVKYNRLLKRLYASFTEGRRAWFELQNIILLNSAPRSAPSAPVVRPADNISLSI